MLTVVAVVRAKKGHEAEVKENLLKQVKPTRREAGCIQYDLHQSIEDPSLFLFFENWTNEEALAAHAQSAHITAGRERNKELLASPVEIFTYRKIEPE